MNIMMNNRDIHSKVLAVWSDASLPANLHVYCSCDVGHVAGSVYVASK